MSIPNSAPQLFGREPALIVALISTGIKLVAAFWIDLSIEQQSALNAVVAAAAGLAIAVTVKDGQVPAILGVASALIALALGFGLKIDPDQQAVIHSFLGLALSMFTRTQVVAPIPGPATR